MIFFPSSKQSRQQMAGFSESVLQHRRGYAGVPAFEAFFFLTFPKQRCRLKHFLIVSTRGIKPRQADVSVTFTANECNICVFITTLLKSINRTQSKGSIKQGETCTVPSYPTEISK
jgi:hypothetical protein